MTEAKPFASLSSGLLARKGAAKPAMRPQGFGHMGTGLEDLGWNDMGHIPSAGPEPVFEERLPEHVPSSIAALTPAPKPTAYAGQDDVQVHPEPPVVEQQRAIAESFGSEADRPERPAKPVVAAEVVALPKRVAPVAPVVPAAAKTAKSAFTLRLDADRHLKLRLACAVTGRSAQHIVTEALDTFLKSIPEIEAMADRVPAKAGKRS